MYYRKIVDVVNNTEVLEELSAAEIKKIEQNIKEANAEIESISARKKARQSALAKLIDLGLTEEEIAAL
jgi:septal ring factor EnvC (AmiA/AmiB activator)